jgi:hypothetical protein
MRIANLGVKLYEFLTWRSTDVSGVFQTEVPFISEEAFEFPPPLLLGSLMDPESVRYMKIK